MDYKAVFDQMHPGFFQRAYIRSLPEGEEFSEMILDLKEDAWQMHPVSCPEGIRFAVYQGDMETLLNAVRQAEEEWLPIFTGEDRYFCAFDGEKIASFCILEDMGHFEGLHIGGPGCVGTVPSYRGKGIGLEMVRRATELLKKEGFDLSWIHYTSLVSWYGRLGYQTILRWTAGGITGVRTPSRIREKIRGLVEGKAYTTDETGMSGSRILLFPDAVLKIEEYRECNEETVRVMRWLEGKIPVPKVLAYEKDEAYQYTLMSRVRGKMSCDTYYLEHPKELLRLLAEALKLLWSIDVSDCPRKCGIEEDLKEARYRVENHMTDPGTFGEDGFRNPEELLQWLEDNRPCEEPVLSHGDFCLPNIFLEGDRLSGFIDLGGTGVGDKWKDIALCYRSLKYNFDGTYGGKVYADFDPDDLFIELGIEPDPVKLRYFTLLDELF